MTESEARQWPDLIKIVEEKVKPERAKLRDTPDGLRLKAKWWQYGRSRPELYQAIDGLDRVLACVQTSKYRTFTFLRSNYVFDQKLVIFPLDDHSSFCVLHSRVHEMWAVFFGSTMKDDPVYTPSDCFQTFPFPKNWESNLSLQSVGKEYYEFRATLMIRNNEGLTATYNRFHDPNEYDPEILKHRELHAAMDRAVLDAYDWKDIPTECEFLLDYEDEENDGETTGRQRKKPWRYRWPDNVRDEVLARLLELNSERAEEEKMAGLADKAPKQRKGSSKGKKSVAESPMLPGF